MLYLRGKDGGQSDAIFLSTEEGGECVSSAAVRGRAILLPMMLVVTQTNGAMYLRVSKDKLGHCQHGGSAD